MSGKERYKEDNRKDMKAVKKHGSERKLMLTRFAEETLHLQTCMRHLSREELYGVKNSSIKMFLKESSYIFKWMESRLWNNYTKILCLLC